MESLALDSRVHEQHYSLCWSDFQSSMVDSFRQLQEHADFVDVTLAVDGYSVQAHRMILSACSPYFKKLLKCNPCQHPVVILQSVTATTLDLLLRFMYSGSIELPRELLSEFLQTAELLQISGLTGDAARFRSLGLSIPSSSTPTILASQQSQSLTPSDSRPSSALNTESRGLFDGDLTPQSPAPTTPVQTTPTTLSITPTSITATPTSAVAPPTSTLAPPTKRARTMTATELVASLLPPSITAIRTSAPPTSSSSSSSQPITVTSSSSAATSLESEPANPIAEEMDNETRAARLSEQHQQLSNAAMAARAVAAAQQEKYGMSLMEKFAGLEQIGASMAEKLTGASPVNPLLGLPNFVANLHHSGFPPSSIHHHLNNGSTGTDTPPSGMGGSYRGRMSSSLTSSSAVLSGLSASSASAIAGSVGGGAGGGNSSLEMMFRLRATDPRPCNICGKTYKNAHTLRTHMEDKHSQCAGFRCVLCGTVAKSRNSLHSHMSRQHRGVSTRDLPLLPMPAPWNPSLAARFIARSGGRGEVVRQQQQMGEVTGSSPQLLQQRLENGSAVQAAAAVFQQQQQQVGLLQQLAAQQRRVPSRGAAADSVPPSATGSAVLDTYLQLMAEQGLDLRGTPLGGSFAPSRLQQLISGGGMEEGRQSDVMQSRDDKLTSSGDASGDDGNVDDDGDADVTSDDNDDDEDGDDDTGKVERTGYQSNGAVNGTYDENGEFDDAVNKHATDSQLVEMVNNNSMVNGEEKGAPVKSMAAANIRLSDAQSVN